MTRPVDVRLRKKQEPSDDLPTMIFSQTKRSKQSDSGRLSGAENLKPAAMSPKERVHAPRIGAFTLMEGLFGIAVMGIVFVALYTGMASGFQSLATSQENLRATQIMVDKFENLRLYTWDQITKSGFIPDAFVARYAPNSKNPGLAYTGTINISPVAGKPYSVDLRAVTITLSWTSHGRTRTETLTSYIARYGLQNYIY
jgi:hypothetical protein